MSTTHPFPVALAAGLVALLAVAGGCSKSSTSQASSESSSRSSTSSTSSSGSSGSSSGPSRYERDVRDYTEQFVLSGGDFGSFRLQLGKIAEKHGVTNWEQDRDTFEGIGRGLKKARVSGERLDQLEKELTSGANAQAPEWLRKGYKDEKTD
jgi:hypothetical protein